MLSLTRELEELGEKVEELERGRRALQGELDELANNQGTADKNVSTRSSSKVEKRAGTSPATRE